MLLGTGGVRLFVFLLRVPQFWSLRQHPPKADMEKKQKTNLLPDESPIV